MPRFSQHLLGVADQRLQRRVGVLRFHDLHQLHLVELVDADYPARVLARAARLAAEARCVGRVLIGSFAASTISSRCKFVTGTSAVGTR